MNPSSGTCLTCERWQRGCTATTMHAERWRADWSRPTTSGLARVYDDAPPCPSHLEVRRRTPYGEVPMVQRIGARLPRREPSR
jgi:hypothetical protein